MTPTARDKFIKKWGAAESGKKGFEADLDLLLRDELIRGITMAAEIASAYDHYNSHPYLVSECILGKLNVLKRRPRKNKAAK